MKKIKLAIAIPSTGTIKSQTVFCLCRMLKDFPHDYTVLFKQGSVLHWMREELVQKALDTKCTHLLFLDSDMSFDKDAVVKLLKRKKAVVGAHYNKRKLPLESTSDFVNTGKDLVEAKSLATGFMLIDLSIIPKLSKPWFFWGEAGEDTWFTKNVQEAGFKVWVDLSLPVKHLGEYAY